MQRSPLASDLVPDLTSDPRTLDFLDEDASSSPTHVRTLLVSDVHLGCKHARADEFLAFIKQFTPDALYLVGDFIDGWKINTGWHWSKACDDVIAHLVELANGGTSIHYVPGNHDSFLRNPAFRSTIPESLPKFEVANEFVLETARGWRFLVTHGDLFDCVESNAQWLSKGTSALYDTCLSLNWLIHRMLLGPERNPYGGCAILKDRVKRWIRFVSGFENKIMDHARENQCDGVICGHIHTPDIVAGDAMWYFNTGDWIENCTGLVERHDGQIHLVRRYDEDIYLQLPTREPVGENFPIRPPLPKSLCPEPQTTEKTKKLTGAFG